MSADSAIQQGIVIITGLSGAGRSTAAKSLEDLDWFVADNLPVDLLPTMADLARRAGDAVPRLAAVVDVRSRAFSTDLKSAISELHARGIRPYVVFLEASDETLVRRFDSVRRPHPLQDTGRVIDGIAAERELLQGMRAEADLVLDTSKLNVHELRARMRDAFASEQDVGLRVTVVSFGYKYGLPVDADMVADCRFLPNPHWIPELAPQTGEDQAVIDYVLSQPGATEFVAAFVRAIGIALSGFGERGRHDVLIAVGCTGGKHRSVVMADRMAEMLARSWPGIRVTHRDLGRE
jgi:RNase adapter protein RapZ